MEDLSSRNPRGCSAIVESERLCTADNVVVSEVIFDCKRNCNVFERKELLGSPAEVEQGTAVFVQSVVRDKCLKLEALQNSFVDIPPGFLPPITEL